MGPEPPLMIGGVANIEHARWFARKISRHIIDSLDGNAEMPKGMTPSGLNDWLNNYCKVNGWDPKHLLDLRTDAQIYADTTKDMLDSPDELMAATDAYLREAEIQMNRADDMCKELAEAPGSEEAKVKMAGREKPRKKWLARIQKVRALRARAKFQIPPGSSRAQGRALSMSHPLRYMIWVGRPGGSRPCFIVGLHHCKMARKVYYARAGEILTNHKWIPAKSDGVLLVLPPGHGKTAFAGHLIAWMISENPRLRCIFLHAQEEMAQNNLVMVRNNFDSTEACGRRNLAMYPGLELEGKKSEKKFRLKLPERQKSPTVMAVGMTAAKSGTDCDVFWPDDPCDQKLAEQPTERGRAWDRLSGTWRTRKRGHKGHFEICTTTLWHHDDPTARMLELVRADKAKFVVSRQSCGGPENGFAPLWAEEYPATYLKARFAEMRNPRLYATIYQSNPQPEELRKIKRLAYYLPGTEEHERFMETAVFHLSMDPTAKRDEKCDKAAFIYCAFGDIVRQGSDEYSYEKRLRVIDARTFHASQAEGVQEVKAFCENHSTHYLHVETRGGFDATREFFEAEGIDIIPHDPGNRKKGLRLGDVAAMLDDSLRDKGFPGAVVEFPGKEGEDGRIIRDEESDLKWVEDQILDFGVATEDHVVDATTQLLKRLGPDLGVSVGPVTQAIRQDRKVANDPRIRKFMDRLFNRNAATDVNTEDARFWAQQ